MTVPNHSYKSHPKRTMALDNPTVPILFAAIKSQYSHLVSCYHKRDMITVLFVISLLMFSAVSGISIGNKTTDHLALQAIRTALRDPVGALNSWNHSIYHCNWEGIECGHPHGRVVALNLSSRGLSGRISPYIGNLSFLYSLDLSNNSLGGEIPPTISNCLSLQIFSISQNSFVGRIPPEFSSLSLLRALALDENELSGPLFGIIQNFTSLEILSATYNGFEGIVPDTIGEMKNLTFLGVGGNQLTGTLPSSICNLSSITVLSFGENNLHGSFPACVESSLPYLQTIELRYNQMTGELPVFLSNISTLTEIDLLGNGFTGNVPWNFARLKDLQWLEIGDNFLGSGDADDLSFINSLVNCTNLEFLDFSSNYFGGVLPTAIANLSTKLKKLKLNTNRISGRIPQGMSRMVNLVHLIMDENQLSGTIPTDIGNLQKLEKLVLGSNMFTGVIPESFGNLSKLSSLLLEENHLQGFIPSSLGKCRYLNYLYLQQNDLRGSIPKDLLAGLPQLVELNLSHNHLEGPLPFEVSNQKTLWALDVSNNKLSGEIPSSIGGCTSLSYLYMQGNRFQGSLPSSVGNLESIQVLDLSDNSLSGPIPRYLSKFPLTNLNLSYNNFEGEVPVGGVFDNTSVVFLVGNEDLCGGILKLHLPRCTGNETTTKEMKPFKIFLYTILGFAFIVFIVYCTCYKRKQRSTLVPVPTFREPSLLNASYKMLRKATDGFSASNLVGDGSFGSVFKGVLEDDNQMTVAVKVLNLQQPGASKSFLAECEALRNVRHRNLVRLVTTCSGIDHQRNDFKALVYEYMHEGNLESWMHCKDQENQYDMLQERSLSLVQRVNIALDVASGLQYLHHDCEVPIVHCDLKPSNILLDNDMVAHVGDFGLAKFLQHSNHSSSLGFRGSIGYAAPEFGLGGDPSTASDIYSYGIVVLEMMTGKRPTDDMFKEGLNLHTYVKKALPDHVVQIVDTDLLNNDGYVLNSVRNHMQAEAWMDCVARIMKVGVACSTESPQDRMNLKDASRELLKIIRDLEQGKRIPHKMGRW